MNFVVTGLSQNYWNPYGGCWLASLKLLAKTQARQVVVNFGLSKNILNLLKKHDVIIVDSKLQTNYRIDTMLEIVKLAKSKEDKFAYFDADIWFQTNFDELFDMLGNCLVAAQNTNIGMMAGTSEAWKKFDFVSKITSTTKDKKVFETFKHFREYLAPVDNTYNWVALGELQEENNLLCFKGHAPAAIHVIGKYKNLALSKNILFSSRYYEECKNFYGVVEEHASKIVAKPIFDCK